MAIVEMRRIQICAMKKDRKKLMELLQRRGIVELADGPPPDEVFTHMDTSATQTLLVKNAETAQRALEILNKYSPADKPMLGFLHGRTAVAPKVADQFYSVNDKVVREAQRLVALQREIDEAKAERLRCEMQLEALAPWLSLPVPLTFKGTSTTAAYIGSVEGEWSLNALLTRLAEAAPSLNAMHVEIVHTTKSQTSFYVLVAKAEAPAAEEALRAIGFARPAYSSSRSPQDEERRLADRAKALREEIRGNEGKIRDMKDRREDLSFLVDHLEMRTEKYAALERLAQTRHVIVLEGWVPANQGEALEAELTASFDCAVELIVPAENEEPPVLLHNSWFTEPTEPVLEAYSMPGKGEIDPIPVMSIFYYFMFGLMFSDAGYGLIMAGVCGFILLKFRNMEPNWSRNMRMFFWCGLSTLFWGIMFSSYFGDVVSSVAETFFGKAVTIPAVWFEPLDDPMRLLVFCLGLGIIHLSAGYVMKAVTCIKNKDYIGIVYDAVFPCLIIYPLIVVLCGTEIFEGISGWRLALSPTITGICYIVAALCAVGIILTGGRESKAWSKRIMKGLYALYNNLSGWLSDTLSYSRLLALGLATGVIASVMNQLAGMAGGNIRFVGFLIYLIVFLIGHALNFGINVLGAYVHSNRLEYVEFFGKFFDGGGRKFAPLGIHTKNYKIVEEETHNV